MVVCVRETSRRRETVPRIVPEQVGNTVDERLGYTFIEQCAKVCWFALYACQLNVLSCMVGGGEEGVSLPLGKKSRHSWRA